MFCFRDQLFQLICSRVFALALALSQGRKIFVRVRKIANTVKVAYKSIGYKSIGYKSRVSIREGLFGVNIWLYSKVASDIREYS